MALTVAQLAAAIRVGTGEAPAEPIAGVLSRLLAVGNAMVAKLAPDAPEDVADAATIQFCGYVFDQPSTSPRASFAAAWRSSGAAALVAPWVSRAAVSIEEAAASATTTTGVDAAAVNALIAAAVEEWARDDTSPIPASKLVNAPSSSATDAAARAAAQAAQTAADAARMTADLNSAAIATKQDTLAEPSADEATTGTATTIRGWTAALIRAAVEAVVVNWARSGNADQIPGGKFARKSKVTADAVNVASTIPPTGDNVGDLLLDVSGTNSLAVYVVRSLTASPYYDHLGTVTGGGSGGVLSPATWAVSGNTDPIPAGKLSALGVQPFAQGLVDVPWAHLDGTLRDFCHRGAVAGVSASDLEEAVAARLLPAAATSGQVPKWDGSAWVPAADETGAVAASKFYVPGQFVRAEDVSDPVPVEDRGKVYLLLRYSATLTSSGGLTAITDHGTGFAKFTGTGQVTRTIATAEAHDFASTFGGDTTSLMQLVTALPGAGSAAWGALYGVSETAGQVEDVYFRRREDTREQLFLPARLSSPTRTIHGFTTLDTDLSTGYHRGGALSPESGIVEIVEELNPVSGKWYLRLIVPSVGLLQSGLAITLRFKLKDEPSTAYSTANSVVLTRDQGYSFAGNHRYLGVEVDVPKFTEGLAYTIRWRLSGQTTDLILNSQQHMRRVIDDEDLAESEHKVLERVYDLEDRVGGGPALPARIEVLEETQQNFGDKESQFAPGATTRLSVPLLAAIGDKTAGIVTVIVRPGTYVDAINTTARFDLEDFLSLAANDTYTNGRALICSAGWDRGSSEHRPLLLVVQRAADGNGFFHLAYVESPGGTLRGAGVARMSVYLRAS